MRSFLFFLCLLVTALAFGNNIMVDNVSLTGQDADNGTTQIQFDLSWENSWRISVGPANYDAAWVFAKYRVNGNIWRHCTLSSGTPTVSPASVIDVVDQTGAFIYRAADGSGDIDYQGLELQWDYQADGVDANAVVDVQVFAIEMVYVPEGAFSVGTGAFDQTNINGNFYTLVNGSPFSLRIPYQVQSEAAITVANSAGNLYYDNTEGLGEAGVGDQVGPIPAAFPKGFNAFYCMKYEVTQDQWIGFFNTLTDGQKANLDVTGVTGKNSDTELTRNGISWPDAGNATTTLPDVALNFVAATYTLSYLDWSGLRPITELEFEKACRGPLPVVNSEYAWGNSNIHNAVYDYDNTGTPDEQTTNPGVGTGNAIVLTTNGTPSGPKRVGLLAASAQNSTREETGGTYYGIMEMTGNVYERCISVGNPPGRAFTGGHGDGQLSFNGAANVPGWPPTDDGIGYRGGSYANDAPFIAVSDRTDASNDIANGNSRLGFRGGRSAQ